jgi:hypothetical protein
VTGLVFVVFNQSGVEYIPAESVYAVFEVKQVLNSSNIVYAQQKIESVRKLKRTSTKIFHAGGTFEPMEPKWIIGGVITLTSSYDINTSDAFQKNILFDASNKKIDIGLCLDSGAFFIDSGEIRISKKDNALLLFFLELLKKLQKIGTVVSMDLDEYIKLID